MWHVDVGISAYVCRSRSSAEYILGMEGDCWEQTIKVEVVHWTLQLLVVRLVIQRYTEEKVPTKHYVSSNSCM